MDIKTSAWIYQELAAPFQDEEIEWRLQHVLEEKGCGLAIPYVDNRAIQNRLDAVVGIDGWKNRYIPWHDEKGNKAKSSQLCGISVFFPDRGEHGEWIEKFDGAENSDIESIKGGLSDSMKRAAVQWGVGRYLYGCRSVWVQVEKKGKNFVIKSTESLLLNRAHAECAEAYRKKLAPKDGANQADKVPGSGQQNPAPNNIAHLPVKKQADTEQAEVATPTAQPQTLQGEFMITQVVKKSFNGRPGLHVLLAAKDDANNVLAAFIQNDDAVVKEGVIISATLEQKQQRGLSYFIMREYRVIEAA